MIPSAEPIFETLVGRHHFPGWLTEIGITTGRGFEVGTYRGEYAKHILENWNGILETCDPFENQPDIAYRDGCVNGGGAQPVNMDDVEEEARITLHPWVQAARCRIHKSYSHAASARVQDGSLDWAYLDANHSREWVQDDIRAWWPKLRHGGILGLHDCYVRNDQYQRCGVWSAVYEFSWQIQQRPHLTHCTSAWFLKT